MTISFHEASVETYSRILDATAATLEKGAAYAKENDKDLSEFVQTKLRDDMMPLHFQVVSTCRNGNGGFAG